jgi:hypothetical protein
MVYGRKIRNCHQKSHPSWAYGAEIIVGTLLVGTTIADDLFNMQGTLRAVYNYAKDLVGVLLIGDGLRRIDGISIYYKNVLIDYLSKKSKE